MKRTLLSLCAFIAVGLGLNAQSISPDVIASSGNSFSNASGSIDWTLGECVTSTLTAGSNILTQGFHQPEIDISSVEQNTTDYDISIFPNPSSDFVNIQFSSLERDVKISLYTTEGKVLRTFLVTPANTQATFMLDMSTYSAGTYFLQVSENNKPGNTYKLLKKSSY